MSYKRGDQVIVVKSTSLSRGDAGTIDKVWIEPNSSGSTRARAPTGLYRVKFAPGSIKRYGEYTGEDLELQSSFTAPVEPPVFGVGEVVVIRQPGEFWNCIATVTNVEYGMAALVPSSTTTKGFGVRLYLPVQVLNKIAPEKTEAQEILGEDEGWVVDPHTIKWTPPTKPAVPQPAFFAEAAPEAKVVLIRPKEHKSVFNVIRSTWKRIFGGK